jgi:tRNA threonylcarbamoyladenosine biosynthesis protein TsaB
LCYAADKSLIAIDTLHSLANGFITSQREEVKEDSLIVPLLDARRMEVYCAVYDRNLETIEKISAKIIDENSFRGFLSNRKLYFFGDGAEKCKPLLAQNPNAIFVDNIFCSAASLVTLADKKFSQKEFVDVALFEPFYLKEFMQGKTQHGTLS